ncbi:threonine-phosphate decarboxylase [Paenibacillus baekrokdamisoli]|uniref:Aminotransferase n=1 Tax=Paenibacillus baekrokdamisoli TaxID=1712516 RepID=A0A3G9J837_9BACL|nr:threonine-phosphate decarboxylase [Paenibacillus baekrokdamisoli]MBB3070617.1 threonine-phosphate decarboxylase [Paenibacillus baekrokdamisoli]BBH19968.1 threonine-phosphate decarboxylase [Paenibacillus baekrokdamisoli]
MLERFGHGGDLLTAQELYGMGADRFLDFSANMNPLGPPPCVADVLRRYADSIGHYPDPVVRGLRLKLANHHSVEEDNILVGNGAAELIDLVVRLLKPAVTVITAPCFNEYGDASRKIGSEVRLLQLKADHQFRLTEELVLQMLSRLRDEGKKASETLWFLGSPNNPTGQLIEPEVVKLLLHEGETVAVDEAFMDFVENENRWSLLEEAASSERLIVIRSMTKFYAIPGIRLGYLVGGSAFVQALGELQIPWSVNSLAQQIGEVVLEDREYHEKTRTWLQTERPWFTEQLSSMGLTVFEGSVNYVLFEIPERFGWTSIQLQQALGKRGILLRDASGYKGLNGAYCRSAVRFRGDHIRLLHELEELLLQGAK